jgi:hypothetical protein
VWLRPDIVLSDDAARCAPARCMDTIDVLIAAGLED